MKKSLQSFKIALIILFAVLGSNALAQTVTIGTGTATQIYPLGNYYGFERSASIYTAAEIGSTTGVINRLAWYSNNAGTPRPIKIYLKTTTSPTLTASTWASQITGATLVYDGSVSPAANFWNEVYLSKDFAYGGGTNNLLVLVEANFGGRGIGGGSAGTSVRYSAAADKHMYIQKDISAPTTEPGTVNNDRPNIQLTFSTPCVGIPTAGSITVNPTSGVAGSTYGVTATGFSTNTGLTFQWQYSDNGGAWNNQGTATTSYAALTGMIAPAFGIVRTWRMVVKCTASALSANSITATFTTTYCKPASTSESTYISNVTTTGGVTNLNHTSTYTIGGYEDNTLVSPTISQVPSGTVNFSVNIAGGTAGIAIFVDWNNNGVFTDSGETVYNSNAYLASSGTGSFTVPIGQLTGNYRMRVMTDYFAASPSACSFAGTRGEIEDYKFIVTAPITPTITLGTNAITAGGITQNTTNNLIYSFKISSTSTSATLTGLKITTSGTYLTAGATNLTAWYQSASTPFNASTATKLATLATPGAAGSKTFPGFTSNPTISNGSAGYIFITTDTPCSATIGNTISASVVPGDTTFSLGSATGTPAPGNTQTFTAATPVNVTGAAASVANTSSSVSWSAPTGCYSEVMIVAMPATYTGALPSGNGSTYTANLLYGSGTALGGGFVVYKGTVFPQNVTGLINGTKYYYKIFTRNGTLWSAGVEVSATPDRYCISTGVPTPNVYFTNFTTTSGSTNINNTSAYSANGYGDFTSQILTKNQAGTVNFTTKINGIGIGAGVGIYVDWNNNGNFSDPGEFVFSTNGYAYKNVTGNFAIPAGANLGNKRMRVVVNFNSQNPAACNTAINGETEDYILNVTAPCTTGTPSSVTSTTFINGLASTGTITNVVSTGSAGYSSGGYKDNTAITLATQIANGPVNLDIDVTGVSFIYVFVDWNKNGNFNDPGETVYSTTNTTTGGATATDDTSFGFIIPAGQAPEIYTMRVRTSPYENMYPGDAIISPCDTGYSSGEAEDFTLKVVADCLVKITGVTPGSTCGPGTVAVGAVSPNALEYRWYATKTGGGALATTTSGSWTTPSIAATTVYYVTAFNGCESLYRTPVKATIFPIANIVFTPTAPIICGAGSMISLSASGDFSTEDLFEEDFETGTLSKFTAHQIAGSVSSDPWSVKTSSYLPNNTTVFKPAINSGGVGTSGNKFAFTTSDLASNAAISSSQALETTTGINTNGFTSLRLTFDHYYSHYSANDKVYVEVSLNGAAYIPTGISYNSDEGSAGDFATKTEDLSAYINVTNLKFRLRYDAVWDDGYAVDNFRLSGTKPLTTNFDWGVNDGNMYTDTLPTPTPYVSHALVPKIYIKPDVSAANEWTYSANTILPNGCTLSKIINVANNTKIWTAGSTNWNTTNWAPNSAVPTPDHCVIIKTPVILGIGPAGFAKNITVESSGSLIINPYQSLTVTNEITNNAGEANFVVESDANLLQVTDTAVNTGKITVKRNSNMKRLDYTYWAAPVTGQNLKTFSPGTVNSRFYTYNEWDDKFTVIDPLSNFFGNNSAGAFESAAKGYAIRANNNYPPGTPPISAPVQLFKGKFEGVPNNGIKNITLAFTDEPHGYNLVGNPYSSNLDFYALHTNNSSVIYNTAYFWTNLFPNPEMQGSSYPGTGFTNNYAVLNGTGGVNGTSTSSAPAGGTAPNQFVKVGQGFIVKAKAPGGKLSFKNAIRTNNSTSIFFNKNGEETNRYWISQTTPLQVVSTQLIGYLPQATNGFELDYDAPLMVLGSDAFYSILDDRKLAIQGKASFINTDVVALGSSQYEVGTYTISLGVKEGIFANGQNIYLKDNQTNTVTNLTEGTYSFAANQGLTEGRFEIMYQPEVVLGTGNLTKNNLVIYRDGNDFVLKSTSKSISGVEVYDASGRLLIQLKPNQKEVRLDATAFVNGTYVLRIDQEGTLVTKKIIK